MAQGAGAGEWALLAQCFFANLARMTNVDGREEMASDRAEFYQRHLDRVSRSFAFCIERLENPLRAHVGLSYLVCRILDTVEDAAWTNPHQQAEAFQKFIDFLGSLPRQEDVTSWRSGFPSRLPEGEEWLLDDAFEIFRDFHQLRPELQAVLRGPVLSMAKGMRHFQMRAAVGGMRLRDLSEVNQYCFFVAGVVGEMLTHLLRHEAQDTVMDQDLDLEKSIHFGLFLQKVNLLKDQQKDEPEGRFLVPSREGVLRSLENDASGAMDYLLSIPERFDGYRLFCAWSLLLGLASLPWIERSFRERSAIKIPREQTLILLGEIEGMIRDNEALKRKFDSLLSDALRSARDFSAKKSEAESGHSCATNSSEVSLRLQELLELYQGSLSRDQVSRLMLA